MNKFVVLLSVFIVFSCSRDHKESSEVNFYTQGNANRVAAEWEPALGTMVAWPLSVPYKLVVELARDNHLYTLVENEASKKEAGEWYTKWGINPESNTFVISPQGIDSWWVRDWGPSAVFSSDGKMKLADGKYIFSTPVTDMACDDSLTFIYQTPDKKTIKTETDDNATAFLAKGLNMDLLDLPYVNTGGNVLTDGLGTAFSSCILLNENKFYGVPKEKFMQLNKDLLGFERYNVLSNFEKRGIQHIDCFMKLLDEERVLVIEPPKDHELRQVYENIVKNELSGLKSAYGRPYEILRIKSDTYVENRLAAYTNSIIINKTIYVPLFQIREDHLALKRWQEVMPGYTVKGFTYDLDKEPFLPQKVKEHYMTYGWDNGDALHCRTRAVWDPEMLFISMKRVDRIIDSKDKSKVYATIIDYSGKGLVRNECKLMWRLAGEKNWHSILLDQANDTQHFLAEIPFGKPGNKVEYYISAASHSGKAENRPATAPSGFYSFSIK
jgi:agmatine deiminase